MAEEKLSTASENHDDSTSMHHEHVGGCKHFDVSPKSPKADEADEQP
ncbi:MAG: hypothetical protein WCF07_09175 [Nitrososphaeraceae archaeon]